MAQADRGGWCHRGRCLQEWVDALSGVSGVSEGMWGSGSGSWWCELAHSILGGHEAEKAGGQRPQSSPEESDLWGCSDETGF